MNPNLCVTRDRGYFAATLVLLLCGSMIGGAASKSFAQRSSRFRPIMRRKWEKASNSSKRAGCDRCSLRTACVATAAKTRRATSIFPRAASHGGRHGFRQCGIKPNVPRCRPQGQTLYAARRSTLPDQAVRDIAAWIGMGAPYDRPLTEIAGEKKPKEVTEIDKQYWAFLPLANPLPPEVKQSDWCRGPIDHFLLAKIEAAQIKLCARGRSSCARPAGLF